MLKTSAESPHKALLRFATAFKNHPSRFIKVSYGPFIKCLFEVSQTLRSQKNEDQRPFPRPSTQKVTNKKQKAEKWPSKKAHQKPPNPDLHTQKKHRNLSAAQPSHPGYVFISISSALFMRQTQRMSQLVHGGPHGVTTRGLEVQLLRVAASVV